MKDIRRRTRRHFSAEDKIRIVLEGLRYFMPLRFSRMKRFESEEFSADDEFASFDDDIVMMRGRIRKLLTEVSWSENPGSKTRHLVSNVMIDVMPEDTYRVTSAFICYRNRSENQVDIWSAVKNAIFVSVRYRLDARPSPERQAGAISREASGSQAVSKARKSAFSHATSNLRLCPAATRMALMASPVAPAR